MAEPPKAGSPLSPMMSPLLQHRQPEAPPSNERLPNGTFFWHVEPPLAPGEPDLVSVAEVMSGTEARVTLRLYYRPDDTPSGRSWRHGKDEVLASRRHASLRVEDAVGLRDRGLEARGDVAVLSHRDYCRERAKAKRAGGDAAAGLPPGERVFVREDFKDPMLECRDRVAVDDFDV